MKINFIFRSFRSYYTNSSIFRFCRMILMKLVCNSHKNLRSHKNH